MYHLFYRRKLDLELEKTEEESKSLTEVISKINEQLKAIQDEIKEKGGSLKGETK